MSRRRLMWTHGVFRCRQITISNIFAMCLPRRSCAHTLQSGLVIVRNMKTGRLRRCSVMSFSFIPFYSKPLLEHMGQQHHIEPSTNKTYITSSSLVVSLLEIIQCLKAIGCFEPIAEVSSHQSALEEPAISPRPRSENLTENPNNRASSVSTLLLRNPSSDSDWCYTVQFSVSLY